jgi:hypothetical protein
MRGIILALAIAAFAAPLSAAAAQNQPSEPTGRIDRQNQVAERNGQTILQNPRAEGALLLTATREGSRLGLTLGVTRVEPPAQRRSWIGRHPALFGALVGAGAGALASVTMENELFCSGGDEDCFFHGGSRVLVGAGFGAGIGALAGLIAGLGSL